MKKIKQIKQRYNCLVYAVTHEYLEFGECYSLLVIPDYKKDWDYILKKHKMAITHMLMFGIKQIMIALNLALLELKALVVVLKEFAKRSLL